MYKDIFDALTAGGFRVYPIGRHRGLCTEPYVVIKEQGEKVTLSGFMSYKVVDVILFCPEGRFSELQGFVNGVRKCLSGLPALKPAGDITAPVIDKDVCAYTCLIRYQLYKRR